MKEVGIDTVYERLKSKVANCEDFGESMDEASWNCQTGVLITGNEAKLLIHYIEMSIEFINEVKAAEVKRIPC